MSAVTAWSYSRWNTYDGCPYAFKLEVIDKQRPPETPAMARGQRVHKGVAAYILQTPGADLPPEAAKNAYSAKLINEIRDQPDKLVEQQWAFTKAWVPTGWFAPNAWLRTVLDAAVLYEDMTLDFVDWKTGKQYAHNKDQTELFALSVFCQYKPVQAVSARLVYLDTGAEVIDEYTRADVPVLKARWETKVAPMFQDTLFAPRPGERCKRCHFSRSNTGICRFG